MSVLLTLIICLWCPFLFAQESASLEDRLNSLELKLNKLGQTSPAPAVRQDIDPSQRFTGLGPVASELYFQGAEKFHFGLSSEFFSYQNQSGVDRSNVTSLAPTFGIRLHRRLLFNGQILLENGGAESSGTVTVQKGQAIVQMAYLDWFTSDAADSGLRVGHQLLPIGEINSLTDPTTYFSVLKPELEREVIPTSWHENGISLWFQRPQATLEAGVFSSLNAAGLRKETFLAGGRSQGQNSASQDLMGVGRLTTKFEHVGIGASIAFGNSAQDSKSMHMGSFQIGEIHTRLHWGRVELKAMAVNAQVQDAEAISILNSTTFPEQVRGTSVQVAFEILESEQNPNQKLWVFLRHAKYNLQDRVALGYVADPLLNKTQVTAGLAYYPLRNLVVKADLENHRTAANTADNSFNLGLGFIY